MPDPGSPSAAPTATCPNCGKVVGTYTSKAGDRVQVHREPKPPYTRYSAWCSGGGSRV